MFLRFFQIVGACCHRAFFEQGLDVLLSHFLVLAELSRGLNIVFCIPTLVLSLKIPEMKVHLGDINGVLLRNLGER